MWTRQSLKSRAKIALQNNYWKCVIVALVVVFVLGTSFTTKQDQSSNASGFHAAVGISSAAVTLLHIFVFNVLEIGCDRFFLLNAQGAAEQYHLLDGFQNRYGRNVLTMFLTRLFIALGFILIVPGFIMLYSYRMVPYILADSDTISRSEAMQLSRRMMNGCKMDAFLLDLSFLGWEILNVITFGVVGIFYVNPYVQATTAELYLALREQHR